MLKRILPFKFCGKRHVPGAAGLFAVFFGLCLVQVSAAPVRVDDVEAKKAAIQKVQPAYPPIARQMNLSGKVLLDLTVDTDGNVQNTDVISGNPILAGSAVSAAKRWKFTPFQTAGKPTEAIVRISFDFTR